MDIDVYIAKKQELLIYRNNLSKLEREIASYGGYMTAPLATTNQYDYHKTRVEELVAAIESMAIAEIQKDANHYFNTKISSLLQENERLKKRISDMTTRVNMLNKTVEFFSQKGTRITKANIFWNNNGFSLEKAEELKDSLQRIAVPCVLQQHISKNKPDSIFIGAFVGAEEARLAIKKIPYDIEYIFRTDYPEVEGGDSTGYTIGIGYVSSHFSDLRGYKSRPMPISIEQIEYLIEPYISNVEFQMRLRRVVEQE